MVLLYSTEPQLNSALIPFNLKGVDGKNYSEKDFENARALVIIFMCNHCPYVKAVIKRFVDFQAKYFDKGVRLVGINSNDAEAYPEDSFENMINFYNEWKMNFPYLVDETQEVAKAYDAQCTPDIYLYDSKGLLKYRGRFDDNWQDETKVKVRDLENAVELVLQGKDVDFKQMPSMGCSIKFKSL